jgi:hypothetical protein
MANFTLTQEQYEALVALARKGAASDREDPAGKVNQLETYLRYIETQNGITRYFLWVQWQEADQPLPPKTKFPTSWPPSMRKSIEFISRPICKADVMLVVDQNASNPVTILVTRDPGATLGWTPIDEFFLQ